MIKLLLLKSNTSYFYFVFFYLPMAFGAPVSAG